MKSIRSRLIAGLLVSLLLLLAVCGIALFATLRARLTAEYDAGLLTKARALATLSERESDGEIEFEFAEKSMPEFEVGDAPEYFEVWLGRGEVLERSPSLAEKDLPGPAGSFHAPVFRDLILPDGRPGRAVEITFLPQEENQIEEEGQDRESPADPASLTLVLARSRQNLDRTLHQILLAMGGLGLLLPLAVALTVVFVVSRGLRPVDTLAAAAGLIDAESLHHRFPENGMPQELKPISRRLNELLQRLEEAFARERRFAGSAAHELRTPVAELRSLTEVASLHPDDSDLARHAVEESLAIAVQMDRLIVALLTLARGEAGAGQIVREPIELAESVEKAWESFRDEVSEREIAIAGDIPPGLRVLADPHLLRAVFSNLFSNAVVHSPEKGQITVQATNGSDSVSLRIENENAALSRADLSHLFEPFWQKDTSRTDAGRSGLGLSIVAMFCQWMDVGIEATLTGNDRVAVELTFPTQSSSESQKDPAAQVSNPVLHREKS